MRQKLFGIFLLTGSVLSGCTPPEELDGDELEPTMNWDELVFYSDPSSRESVATTEESAAVVSRIAAVSGSGSELSRQIALNSIENPSPYAGGLLGAKGDSKYFIASLSAIPEYNRLYWVMVKVLSEKYSCFIKSKQEIGSMTRITCRDKRQVLFWKKQSGQYIEFLARQFDRDGYEIKVIRKKIVRISNVRVI